MEYSTGTYSAHMHCQSSAGPRQQCALYSLAGPVTNWDFNGDIVRLRASHGPAMAVDLAGTVRETAGAEGTQPAQMPAKI
jgi:hypothetical protein